MSFRKQKEPESEYELARRAAVKRIQRQILFFIHATIWMLAMIAPQGNFYGPPPAIVWSPVLLAHFLTAFGFWERWVERATQRELQRRQRAGYVVSERIVEREKPKAKRDESPAGQVLRLSDDGELEAVDSDEAEAVDTRSRRSGRSNRR